MELYIIGLLAFSAFMILLAIILYIILKPKTMPKVSEPAIELIDTLSRMQTSKKPSQQKLAIINQITKQFFKNDFKLKQSASYSELVEDFRQIGLPEFAAFCETMQKVFYSGEPVTPEMISKITQNLMFLIKKSASLKRRKQEKNENPAVRKIKDFFADEENPKQQQIDRIDEEKIISEAKSETSQINLLQNQTEDFIYEFMRKFDPMIKVKVRMEEQHEFLEKYPKELSELRKASSFLEKMHYDFNLIFLTAYKTASKTQKKSLDSLSKRWNLESKEIKKTPNTFEQHYLSLKTFEKYLAEFKKIILNNEK